MTIEKIGINFTAMANSEPLNVTITEEGKSLINEIPRIANEVTGGYLAYFILFALAIITYFALSDKGQFGDYGYSDARALGISFAISSIVGITEMEINFITNFKAVAMFILLFMLMVLYILFYENKE